MLILSVNTAGPACDVAVLGDTGVIAARREEMSRGQDAKLAGLCAALMGEAGLDWPQLDRLAVVTGPGSFTGVRIGVAFMRGLALALDLPCIGVTSLEAAVPAGEDEPCLSILPAQARPPDKTYWAQSLRGGEGVLPPEELSQAALDRRLLGADGPVHRGVPSALIAGRKAVRFDPAAHPPAPTYVRAPDAAPMPPG